MSPRHCQASAGIVAQPLRTCSPDTSLPRSNTDRHPPSRHSILFLLLRRLFSEAVERTLAAAEAVRSSLADRHMPVVVVGVGSSPVEAGLRIHLVEGSRLVEDNHRSRPVAGSHGPAEGERHREHRRSTVSQRCQHDPVHITSSRRLRLLHMILTSFADMTALCQVLIESNEKLVCRSVAMPSTEL